LKEKTFKEIFLFSDIHSKEAHSPERPLKRLQGIQINDFFFNTDGMLWLASNDGVFKMETNFQSYARKSIQSPLISRIRCLPDSNIFQGNFLETGNKGLAGIGFAQSPQQFPHLPFELNSISFSFSTNQFNDADGILYSTMLDGLEDNWTNWSKETSREFSKLPEGNYVFRVKAKSNLLGDSPETTFSFSIQAPWYRSLWAYSLYFIAGLLTIRLLIVWNIRRLKALNELLENTVTSRTRELHVEKSKVEEKNREITDSIHYAKVIQTSILPKTNSITRHFDEAFILYQPRDIVSGDFYWFSELRKSNLSDEQFPEKKTVLVVADCTGHGVPGAFMSMIGTEKLTQAIRELPVLNASAILSFLNVEVRKSLNQGNEESQSHDGMEMALCIIDHEHHSIEFAGANRPLVLFRKEAPLQHELLKSTKTGIAGFTPDDQVFESVHIQLKKGDRVYLYTDGLPDQFGGPQSKKLGTKGLMKMLADIQHLSLSEQEKEVTKFLSDWKVNEDQVDDILLMAFSI
jgi:serine phosphatase RsbU (regulator of sigma subunit)